MDHGTGTEKKNIQESSTAKSTPSSLLPNLYAAALCTLTRFAPVIGALFR